MTAESPKVGSFFKLLTNESKCYRRFWPVFKFKFHPNNSIESIHLIEDGVAVHFGQHSSNNYQSIVIEFIDVKQL